MIDPINTTAIIISMMVLQYLMFIGLSVYWWYKFQKLSIENFAYKEHVKDAEIIDKVKTITDRAKLIDLVKQDLSRKLN